MYVSGLRHRVLIVRLGAMGDVLHALPAVSTIRDSFPDSEITWIIEPKWIPLLEGNRTINRILPFDRRSWTSVRHAWNELRIRDYHVSFDFQGLIKSAVLPWAARCRNRIGFHKAVVREKPAAWFYTITCWPDEVNRHVVDRNIVMATMFTAANVNLTSPIPMGEPEGTLPAEGPFVLTSPFAGWTSKQWPLEYFSELARLLAPLPLVVNGPPSAEADLRRISGAQVHLSGIPGLIDATRRAAAVVGVDSGPLHLAAALAKPGVAIFGPTDPASHGPYGWTMEVLRAPDAVTSYKREPRIVASMRAIGPQAVAEAVVRKLKGV
jgi:heptosyltransferase I